MSTVGDLDTPAAYFTQPAPATAPGLVEALARLGAADTTARAVRVNAADLAACQRWLDNQLPKGGEPVHRTRCVAAVLGQIRAGFQSYRKKGQVVLCGADLADYLNLLHRTHAARRPDRFALVLGVAA